MQDVGGRHLEKSQNRDISATFDRSSPFSKIVKSPYLCNHLTDFDEIWQDDTHWPLTAD